MANIQGFDESIKENCLRGILYHQTAFMYNIREYIRAINIQDATLEEIKAASDFEAKLGNELQASYDDAFKRMTAFFEENKAFPRKEIPLAHSTSDIAVSAESVSQIQTPVAELSDTEFIKPNWAEEMDSVESGRSSFDFNRPTSYANALNGSITDSTPVILSKMPSRSSSVISPVTPTEKKKVTGVILRIENERQFPAKYIRIGTIEKISEFSNLVFEKYGFDNKDSQEEFCASLRSKPKTIISVAYEVLKKYATFEEIAKICDDYNVDVSEHVSGFYGFR